MPQSIMHKPYIVELVYLFQYNKLPFKIRLIENITGCVYVCLYMCAVYTKRNGKKKEKRKNNNNKLDGKIKLNIIILLYVDICNNQTGVTNRWDENKKSERILL